VIAQQLSLDDAIAARDVGVARVLHHSDEAYREALMRAIEKLAATRPTFISDDLRELCGDPPAGTHPNVAGAVVSAAVREGLIRCIGYAHSARAKGHSNLIRVWTAA